MNKKARGNESTLGEAIERLLKAYRMDGKMKELDVISSWEELMGKAIALRTTNIFIKEGILHLTISSSVMRDELKYGKQVIIERVNQKAGNKLIDDIWFY
jgi:predicted nucleic acid-binding Zn ribbon protein